MEIEYFNASYSRMEINEMAQRIVSLIKEIDFKIDEADNFSHNISYNGIEDIQETQIIKEDLDSRYLTKRFNKAISILYHLKACRKKHTTSMIIREGLNNSYWARIFFDIGNQDILQQMETLITSLSIRREEMLIIYNSIYRALGKKEHKKKMEETLLRIECMPCNYIKCMPRGGIECQEFLELMS